VKVIYAGVEVRSSELEDLQLRNSRSQIPLVLETQMKTVNSSRQTIVADNFMLQQTTGTYNILSA